MFSFYSNLCQELFLESFAQGRAIFKKGKLEKSKRGFFPKEHLSFVCPLENIKILVLLQYDFDPHGH